jgi:hypothetical protein
VLCQKGFSRRRHDRADKSPRMITRRPNHTARFSTTDYRCGTAHNAVVHDSLPRNFAIPQSLAARACWRRLRNPLKFSSMTLNSLTPITHMLDVLIKQRIHLAAIFLGLGYFYARSRRRSRLTEKAPKGQSDPCGLDEPIAWRSGYPLIGNHAVAASH